MRISGILGLKQLLVSQPIIYTYIIFREAAQAHMTDGHMESEPTFILTVFQFNNALYTIYYMMSIVVRDIKR